MATHRAQTGVRLKGDDGWKHTEYFIGGKEYELIGGETRRLIQFRWLHIVNEKKSGLIQD
jgi:hypothetical protein